MFKVGDLVTAIEGTSYSITKEGIICKVIDTHSANRILYVEVCEGENKHKQFNVRERDFCKVKDIPTIGVFIKKLRATIGKVFGSKEDYAKSVKNICPSCKLFHHANRIFKLKVTYGEIKYEFKIKFGYTLNYDEIFIESISINGECIWKE